MVNQMENMMFGGQGVKDHTVLPAQMSGGVSWLSGPPVIAHDQG